MRLLITGAGLVGTGVARAAHARGDEVVLLDAVPDPAYVSRRVGVELELVRCDVTDLGAVVGALARATPDAIVHTAAVFGPRCVRAPALATRVNVGGTATVLEAALRSSVARVVLISSLAVYAWSELAADRPVPEAAPVRPATLYGASKLAAEHVGRCLAREGVLAVSALRLAGVYGFGHFRGGSVVGAALQRAAFDALRSGTARLPALLHGREHLYVADASAAVLRDLDVPLAQWRLLNIGSGRVHSAADVADALIRAVPGTRVEITGAARPAAPPLDVTSARDALGDLPVTELAEGLRQLVAESRRGPMVGVGR